MHKADFGIIRKEGMISVFPDQGSHKDTALFTITPKPWDSDFFKRKHGTLQIETPECLDQLSDWQITEALGRLAASADENGYDVIDLHISINRMRLIPILEETGFRLVDSRITFITLINKDEQALEPLPARTVKYAAWEDFDAIVHLTNESFVHNENFLSRFKNRRYYTADETARYYKAWIANHIDDKDTYFIVVKDKDRLFAYYIYKKTGFLEETPVYKAILTAVDPDYRGNRFHMRMQAHLFQQFPEKTFFLDNTSQLTNIPTIKSYIKSQKQLKSIELTFYRLKNAELSIL